MGGAPARFMTDLRNERALVTGACRGMGFLIARALAERGAEVVLWDLDERELAAAASRIGPRASFDVVDVADRAAVFAAAAALGPVHVLVNNAGVVAGKPLLDLTPEDIERTFRVNTLAHFWTLQAFLPAMIARDAGHVVSMASAAGLCAVPRLADYSASKAAAIALDESLRLELRRAGSRVRTTVVCPFFVDTGMFAGAKTRWPLLLPILRPDDVAARVVRAIVGDRSRVLMPWTLAIALLARLLPVAWFDALASFLGVTVCMDDFVGHAGALSASGKGLGSASGNDHADERPATTPGHHGVPTSSVNPGRTRYGEKSVDVAPPST